MDEHLFHVTRDICARMGQVTLIKDQAAHFGGRIIDTTIGYGYKLAQLAKARSQVCHLMRFTEQECRLVSN